MTIGIEKNGWKLMVLGWIYNDKYTNSAYNNNIKSWRTENNYIIGNKANYDWLMESKAQLEKGKTSMHKLLEVDVDE